MSVNPSRKGSEERDLMVWASSMSSSPTDKDFEVHIAGNEVVRDEIIKEYYAYVREQLGESGVNIHASGRSGDLDGFDFKYRRAGMTGIFRVTSAIETSGCVQVNVFMYEHR